MDCQAINREELAEKYVHHRLDATLVDEFETHLLECPKCARELELLQAMQTDLAERAHEIRDWTASRPHFFRWRVVVLAGIVVVVATASLAVRWQKMQSASVTAPPPPQANPPTGETMAKEHEANTTEKTPKTPEPQTASPDSAKMQVVQVNPPKQMEHLPTNRRDYRGFERVPSPISRDSAPSIGRTPTSSAEKKVESALSNEVKENIGKVPDNAQDVFRDPQQVSAENAQPASGTGKTQVQLTAEQGVEIYRVGAVEAPPFTFAGFAAHAKPPKGGKSSTYSGKAGAADTGRVLFHDGMNAYIDARYHDASGYLRSALKYEPSAADVNFYLGVCRILDGHPAESIPALKIAIAAGNSPYLQSAHYYLGKAYVQELNLEGAEMEFREATRLPGQLSADAKAMLARIVGLREQIEKNRQ